MSKYFDKMTQIVTKIGTPTEFKLSGPAKISTKNKCAFSAPAGPEFSCPGATAACAGCYAQKNRHMWPMVQTVMADNWKLLREFERNGKQDECAAAIVKQLRKGPGVFRLYESGDFHSQWIVDMWAKVVGSRPEVDFWGYTRSFHLNFTNLTRHANFALWASTDPYNTKAAKAFVRRFSKSGTKHAYGPWKHDALIPTNSFICPVTNHKMEVKGACEKCFLCIVKRRTSKNVVFLEH